MEQDPLDPTLSILENALSAYKSSHNGLDQTDIIKQLISDLSTITID